MAYLSIVKVAANGRVEKYQDYPTEAEARAHVERVKAMAPDAYVVQHPGGRTADWLCDPVAKTVVFSPLPQTASEINSPILAAIATKERLTLRPIRELRRAQEFADVPAGDVTFAKNRLKALDDEISALRGQLVP